MCFSKRRMPSPNSWSEPAEGDAFQQFDSWPRHLMQEMLPEIKRPESSDVGLLQSGQHIIENSLNI